ncbi:MAG: hypothetical protein HWN65_23020 [Candidatus Helarchaeota archaeon]|nr:hypothetical protein [Candidatus Helarchaeota archaeon]
MTRKFILNGLKTAPVFIADLKSDVYLARERQKQAKKHIKKQLKHN